jgi:hypothetical protein
MDAPLVVCFEGVVVLMLRLGGLTLALDLDGTELELAD